MHVDGSVAWAIPGHRESKLSPRLYVLWNSYPSCLYFLFGGNSDHLNREQAIEAWGFSVRFLPKCILSVAQCVIQRKQLAIVETCLEEVQVMISLARLPCLPLPLGLIITESQGVLG